ncbi:hydrogenase maturation protease [Tepidibacter aestuarii]|uniref:hydrogenase maturation protease n=1 Tax=Tepidibacter aestuarii TaxID=2925782 RepID=UPI0020C101A9|nr:hydrogenase maturation protease [Tepidibacter aestuarii]CAH2213925.1 Hydrogenase maturation protease [Tepidibacter aestuarii]
MIKVIGIGNRVMGDDGVAVYVLEKIKDKIKKLNSEIEVIIGETDFLYCLNEIDDNDFVIILDSTYLGLECGTVSLFSFEESKRYLNNPETQHDINLVDMIINYKNCVKGYIIGIEVFDVDFRLSISDSLNKIFKNICNDVLNKIKRVLNNIEGGK